MKKQHIKPETYFHLSCEERWATFGLFNCNAYPPELESLVNTCSTRSAIFLFNVNGLNKRVLLGKNMFIKQLINHFTKSWTQHFIKSGRNKNLDFIVIYDGLDYLSDFHTLLYSLKSLLDVYANLMAKLIVPSAKLFFSKGVIDGEKISGGKIAKWIKDSTPSTYSNRALLSNVIIKHSKDWITQAVNYRDTLIHYNDIAEMKHMQVLLKRQFPPFDQNDITLPRMPNGQLLTDYSIGMVDRLSSFLKETLELLPHVDHSKLAFGDFKLPN